MKLEGKTAVVLGASSGVGKAVARSLLADASDAGARALGVTPTEYMLRFEVPLDSDKVAAAIVQGLSGALAPSLTALAVTGSGIEPLA